MRGLTEVINRNLFFRFKGDIQPEGHSHVCITKPFEIRLANVEMKPVECAVVAFPLYQENPANWPYI